MGEQIKPKLALSPEGIDLLASLSQGGAAVYLVIHIKEEDLVTHKLDHRPIQMVNCPAMGIGGDDLLQGHRGQIEETTLMRDIIILTNREMRMAHIRMLD